MDVTEALQPDTAVTFPGAQPIGKLANHPQLAEIKEAILAGEPLRKIALRCNPPVSHMLIQKLRKDILKPLLDRSSQTVAHQALTAVKRLDRNVAREDFTSAVIAALVEPGTAEAIQQRTRIIDAIKSELDTGKGLVRLRAAEMLGRLPAIDLWQERNNASGESTQAPAEIRSNIRQKLCSLLAQAPAGQATIDIEPEQEQAIKPASD